MKRHIAKLLRELGAPANVTGYYMLQDAIEMVMEDRKLLIGITDGLYTEVGKKHDATWVSAERAMRYCIKCIWENGNKQMLQRMFLSTTEIPSLSRFVSTLAEEVKEQLAEGAKV